MEEHAEIPVVWVGMDEHQTDWANVFHSAFQPEEFVLSLGQLVPPTLTGTPEQQRQQLRQAGYIGVKVVARVSLSRRRMGELAAMLQENIANHDAAMQTLDDNRDETK